MSKKGTSFSVNLKMLNRNLEVLIKAEYHIFEDIIFEHIEHINKLNALMLECKKRLKENLPDWAWKV